MPVSFLSTTQRERYSRYPDTLSGDTPVKTNLYRVAIRRECGAR
jgi:hypothetical protein